jgi:hypothetical protein
MVYVTGLADSGADLVGAEGEGGRPLLSGDAAAGADRLEDDVGASPPDRLAKEIGRVGERLDVRVVARYGEVPHLSNAPRGVTTCSAPTFPRARRRRLIPFDMTALMNFGTLVISLDFELYWGVRDRRSLASYRENLLGVRKVVPRLLELFSLHGVHATWATVGFLFFETKEELLGALPEERPAYGDGRLSPYEYIAGIGPDEKRDPFHYAASLIQEVAAVPTQEIGTHTFSHYYCLEPGQDATAFEADLRAAVEVARRRGISIDSIAFPRNQVNAEYLPICLRHGIRAYRGNQHSLLYTTPQSGDRAGRRLLRLIDAYVNLSSHHAYSIRDVAATRPLNVPESRFLRPYQGHLAALEPRRSRRLLMDLEHAAEHGLLYHLWWHPHNFGANLERNFEVLGRVLDRFASLRETHGMQSMAMREVAAQVEAAFGAKLRPAAASDA